jgi:phage gp46-like protein
MSDLALILQDDGCFDAQLIQLADGQDLATDHDLQTAVAWSLFSNRRAESGDRLPCGDSNRQGWCLGYLEPQVLGSRLWLLRGAKSEDQVRLFAEDAATEALAWLLQDKVAKTVEINASLSARPHGPDAVIRTILVLNITITRPDNSRWQHVWNLLVVPATESIQ